MQHSTLAELALEIMNKLARASLYAARDAIDETLAALGEATGFDRTYLFRLRDGLFWDNTNEWVAQGITPMITRLQGLPREMVAPWEDALLREESVFIPDVAGLPDERMVERDFLQDQGIRSIFIVPMLENGQLTGFLGYDAVRAPRNLTQDELRILKSVSNGIGAFSLRLSVEAALFESRDRQAAMLAAMPDLILQLDGDGILREIHAPPSIHILRSAQDLVGTRLEESLPPDLARVSKEMRVEAASSGQSVVRRYSLSVTGSNRWYEARLGRGKLGDVFVVRDVTTEHQAEEQRAQHLRFLAGLFTAAPLGVLLMDRVTGRLLDVNTAFATASGYRHDELLQLRAVDLMASEFLSAAEAAVRDLDKAGRYGPLYKEYTRKDGSRWPIITHGVAATDAEGRQVIWTYVEDLTEQRAREEEIRTALVRAEAANRAKSTFLANMSHEIRTPLNGVLGMAEILQSQVSTPEKKRMVATIQQSGETLLALLNSILDMSKIEAGKLTLENVPIQLTKLIFDIEPLHRIKAEEKGVHFEVFGTGGRDPARLGDPHRLTQILNNLLSNAIKFCDSGEVRMLVSARTGRSVVIEVSDTGIGMTEEQVARVFDSFEQAEASTSQRFGGTGLGLTIVRQLVHLMMGTIEIESSVGAGTTVRLVLPLPEVEAVVEVEPPVAAERDVQFLKGQRVLIADDNPTNLLVLNEMLAPTGVKIVCATNGMEAVTEWQAAQDEKRPFDLLLLDVRMPVKDGPTALKEIRELEGKLGLSEVAAIAVTANAMPQQVTAYLMAGFASHLAKPFSRTELFGCVASLMNEKLRK